MQSCLEILHETTLDLKCRDIFAITCFICALFLSWTCELTLLVKKTRSTYRGKMFPSRTWMHENDLAPFVRSIHIKFRRVFSLWRSGIAFPMPCHVILLAGEYFFKRDSSFDSHIKLRSCDQFFAFDLPRTCCGSCLLPGDLVLSGKYHMGTLLRGKNKKIIAIRLNLGGISISSVGWEMLLSKGLVFLQSKAWIISFLKKTDWNVDESH